MASLIAFQLYRGSKGAKSGKYMAVFTAVNVGLLVLLLGFQIIIMKI
jgi:hypothetical protein